jgi:hypothetical protein
MCNDWGVIAIVCARANLTNSTKTSSFDIGLCAINNEVIAVGILMIFCMDFMPWVGTRNAYFANHYARQYQRDLLKQ